MRLNINLASQRYEVAQGYRQRMTVVITALAVVAALLVGYIVYQRQNTRAIDAQLSDMQQQIRSLDHEESQARAILNKPANKVVADQSDFLNQLFERKSLSWTRIFTEMEKIVPAGLHVVSMKPEYTKTNDMVLHVVVATDSRERAVEMVRHMEKSSHLRQAQIVAESVTTNSSDQSAGGGNIQFDIAALYVAGAAENENDKEESSPRASDESNVKSANASVNVEKPPVRNNPAPIARPAANANVAAPVNARPPLPGGLRSPAPAPTAAPSDANAPPHLEGGPIPNRNMSMSNQEPGNAPAVNAMGQPYYRGPSTGYDNSNGVANNGLQNWPRRPGVRQH